jgi:hypothetical protein
MNAPKRHRVLPTFLLMALVVPATACLSTAPPERTGLATQAPEVTANARQVSVGITDLAGLWLGAVEWRGDQIRAATEDPEIRRNALLWKINASGAMLRATSHSDPLIAVLDAWTLIYQFRAYFEDGAGAAMFGEQKPIVTELIDLAEAEIEQLAGTLATPEGVANARQMAAEFAAREPISNPYFVRRSTATEIVASLSESRRDAFAQLGTITETVEGLASRVSLYAEYLPKLARWQAELALEDPITGAKIDRTLDTVDHLRGVADHAVSRLDEVVDYKLDEVLTTALTQVAAEMDDVERLVNVQRRLILEQLPQEYEAIFEHVTEQRLAALSQVEAEIDEALAHVDTVVARSLEDAGGLTRDTVDYAVERATPLLIGTFFGLLILILVFRLVPQRVSKD